MGGSLLCAGPGLSNDKVTREYPTRSTYTTDPKTRLQLFRTHSFTVTADFKGYQVVSL